MDGIETQNVDWGYCASLAIRDDLSDAEFMERLMLGACYYPLVHILIPTCFGVFLDEHRDEKLRYTERQFHPNKAAILTMNHQDGIFRRCCVCTTHLKTNARVPYQVAMRVVAGWHRDSVLKWHYDGATALLCRRCQTRSWLRLLLGGDAVYNILMSLVNELCFADQMSVPRSPEHTTEAALCIRLTRIYLERLSRVNTESNRMRVMSTVVRYRREQVCDHCALTIEGDPETCVECGGIFRWCSGPTRDPRVDPLQSCAQVAQRYHGVLCDEIRNNPLVFECEDAWFIRRDGADMDPFLPIAEFREDQPL